jgi:hypothetical protein
MLIAALAPAARADGPTRRAVVMVSAGEGVSNAEAAELEMSLWQSFASILLRSGFVLEPLDSLHAVMTAQGIPKDEQHQPGNSPSNTAMIVEMRKRDVELVWMGVLSRDNEKTRLALTAMAFHDLAVLGPPFSGAAPSLTRLEEAMKSNARILIPAALTQFKPTPMPVWWRPELMIQQAQASAQANPVPPVAVTTAPIPTRSAEAKQPRLKDAAQVAVLDFRHGKQFSAADARYLSDVIRAAVLKIAPRLSVMTRENLIVLLQASGKDLNDCEGECEVDTGRRIGADAVISGEVLKFGAHYKLSLRLHETKTGRLIAATVASGATLEELDADLQLRAAELLSPQR